MNRIRTRLAATLVLVAACSGAAAAPPRLPPPEAQFTRAVDAFRQARFSEAYGLFIELADGGHHGAARYALFMCGHGLDLFGKNWDCAPHDVQDWSDLAGVTAPLFVARSTPRRH